ncbi:MAG: type II toxin-antitoxin system RatA family toxin [Methylicorpusculum sp.]|uniref:type II toxin-antitoxin system RatA family toxin n=1 Tax=Methylicorpusculum sp. TaxID=2713644 RepID=UPI002720D1BA|nr:type II toxin-antitoxin system RatA family toxin [Methylicorpusculum sp.]MDO8844522.1 type II toxin-antitoxin system RatA family toxin [Methylicorpusculum sp.]MDO8941138.1 type II toxin-antitoxin system RatA family toxin [Methylicorpusculum sp.]MDO9238875.1 type II toxin-antitoxin system RatA family toxin [Methylicorpusculum sp.]MDP2176933.1 type II toxin-antitoxin system RatA family toxin [Methylicorpusculum sp.]MDP3528703.1 type II toxin-antitoxin system RatA family toxin [Methylicorpuscu
MTMIQKSALVKYAAHQMFDLVDDVEAYPEFLPWCAGSRVINRSDDIVEAELLIAKGGFKKSFATRNCLDRGGRITIALLNGPFNYLQGRWDFIPLREDASKISLDLEFEMSGLLANIAFGTVFNQICNTMVGSFTQRAKQVYG